MGMGMGIDMGDKAQGLRMGMVEGGRWMMQASLGAIRASVYPPRPPFIHPSTRTRTRCMRDRHTQALDTYPRALVLEQHTEHEKGSQGHGG